MTKTPAERQASSRAQKKAAAFVRTTLRLDTQSIVLLRRLAKRHKATQPEVIKLALLLEESRLAKSPKQQPPARQTAPTTPAPAPRRDVLIIKSAVGTDTPATPTQPPERPSSSPQRHEFDDTDAHIRAAAFVVEP